MHEEQYLTTRKFAEGLGVETATVWRSHSVRGHYHQAIPIKLTDNGRLLWRQTDLERILRGQGVNDHQGDGAVMEG